MQSSHSLWSEASATSAYLSSKVPTPSLGGGTPYSAWHGSPPSLKHLHVFRVFVHVDWHQGKLRPKAREVCLVRYNGVKVSWRVGV
ncbi:unnamed protein product, partial [Choristocarpus tenellus]